MDGQETFHIVTIIKEVYVRACVRACVRDNHVLQHAVHIFHEASSLIISGPLDGVCRWYGPQRGRPLEIFLKLGLKSLCKWALLGH